MHAHIYTSYMYARHTDTLTNTRLESRDRMQSCAYHNAHFERIWGVLQIEQLMSIDRSPKQKIMFDRMP